MLTPLTFSYAKQETLNMKIYIYIKANCNSANNVNNGTCTKIENVILNNQSPKVDVNSNINYWTSKS